MSADTAPLSKVDSAVEPGSPTHEHKLEHKARRRSSASNPDVHNINDLEKQNVDLAIAPETQKLNWKLNTSPATLEDWKDALKKPLVTPMVKKIDLHFPLGLDVTARNLKGVTIKDALDAIYKQFKKRSDDELDNPILAGFEWDREECYTRFIVHQKKDAGPAPTKKSKKKDKEAKAEEALV
ncbi:uncharacterized protein K452DRAFT_285636 [Aplosporella prunicola CBS 121167]|uniref:DUF6699 domain-containing protein n=1 Tax=Aplosporella prunicola CBS 121167 TaxID=1176127 RepID=A0A6A6BIY7_9PEZI|nr:uncharacterized protein K452DRAFT_285636 [Aplosporella prunicola CBS 121167]KAF2143598.1 hypothetical protein K452DRAFT_285636 [Aplosporella prunicola CBS 121167]